MGVPDNPAGSEPIRCRLTGVMASTVSDCDKCLEERSVGPRVRAIYGASLSPDATAFAHMHD